MSNIIPIIIQLYVNYIYMQIHIPELNRSKFFLEIRHIIHKEIYLNYFLSCVFNISFNIMQKRVYWSLESRRPDSVWAEWVPNTFLFHNLALKLRIFGQVDQCLVFLILVDCNQDQIFVFFCIDCNQDPKSYKV